MKNLAQLKMGQSAVIHSFKDGEFFLKLMEMGIIPGERIRIEQVAMLGDPISVYVAGYNLSLRLEEAEQVYVEDIK